MYELIEELTDLTRILHETQGTRKLRVLNKIQNRHNFGEMLVNATSGVLGGL